MKRDVDPLTPEELEIMKVVWQRAEPVTVRDVYEELLDRRWIAYTSVMTMMNDLERKGHLRNRRRPGHAAPPDEPEGEMSVDLLARNLLVWWLHAGVLMATGLAAVHFLRWRHPASRLRFWQTLLAGALLLPIVEPWHVPIDASLAPLPPARAAGILTVTPAAIGQVDAPLRWQPWLLAVACAGIAGRALWLVAGLWRLRRWRRAGTPVTIDGLTGVDVREVDDLRGPASFGWAEPVILLPRTLTDPEVRAVAIAHEHQHVLRQDWLAGMLERTKQWPAAAPIATTTSNRCWLPRVSPMRRRCPSPNSSAAAISWREWNNSSRSVPCPPSAWPAPPALPS